MTVCYAYMSPAQFLAQATVDAVEPWVAQPFDKSTTGHTVPSDPGENSGTADDVRATLLSRGPATDFEIGQLVDGDWEGLDSLSLLSLYAPRLLYDTYETYRSDSPAVMTNSYVDGDHTNKLVLEDETIAASSDPDEEGETLTLEYLGATYPDSSISSSDDNLDAANWNDDIEGLNVGQAIDAATMHGIAAYADKTYGQVLEAADGTTILQYWFFYYANPKQFFATGEHEGDWESIQVVLDDDLVPMVATYSQHNTRETCFWADVERTSDDRPIVYVAEGSHASYFTAGTHEVWASPYVVSDSADGANSDGPTDLQVVDVTNRPDWVGWAGRWGASVGGTLPFTDADSPQGPLYHGQYDAEGAYDWTWTGAKPCQNT